MQRFEITLKHKFQNRNNEIIVPKTVHRDAAQHHDCALQDIENKKKNMLDEGCAGGRTETAHRRRAGAAQAWALKITCY
ncbi:hypothetical protein [Azoarcus sp. DD4]|uniref:hypothetical protein n=1 Tax=Azoarcus sp. DD4 TaxID=2027405 RepID=UPI00112CF5EB|nr:hypothetical protein [Azoarcus sp. DD4]